jgi:hypothetical protein
VQHRHTNVMGAHDGGWQKRLAHSAPLMALAGGTGVGSESLQAGGEKEGQWCPVAKMRETLHSLQSIEEMELECMRDSRLLAGPDSGTATGVK